jgi:hypothetical protein
MLKLLLVTLGTWSGVSVFLVGTVGSLICLRNKGPAQMSRRIRAENDACR